MDNIVDYEVDTHSFVVLNNYSEEIIYIPYCLLDKDDNGELFKYKSNNYGYKIFFKKDFVENNIFQVFEGYLNSRIGWLFPVSSIISKAHDYAENPHYSRYAFVAHHLILTNEISEREIIEQDFVNIINQKFTNTNAILFIYEKSLISSIPDFETRNYYCSFYQYGYYLKNEDPNPEAPSLPTNGKITIHRITPYFATDKFLNDFFGFLFFEKYPIIKFHILYQIIELLIEDILIFSLEDITQKFKDKKIYTRSLREKISRVEKESDRILLLIDWCKTEFDPTILHERCNEYLSSKGRENFNFPLSLYAFRNFIVHDFRHMIKDIEAVEKVNYQFELLVLNLLTTYSHKS